MNLTDENSSYFIFLDIELKYFNLKPINGNKKLMTFLKVTYYDIKNNTIKISKKTTGLKSVNRRRFVSEEH